MEILFALLATSSIVSYAGYMIMLKQSKDRLIVLFWASLVTYIGYLGLLFIRKTVFAHDTKGLEQVIYHFTFTNMPLYIAMAISAVTSLALLNYLLDHFDVSLVVPVTETGILFTTIGYVLLGEHFSYTTLASIIVVFIGALFSGLDTFSFKKPLAVFKKFPLMLLIGGLLEALCDAFTLIITFICTKDTPVTEKIMSWLSSTFEHIHHIPFNFLHPFYYNLGVRFFIVSIFFFYIVFIKKYGAKIITECKEHYFNIIAVSCCFLIYIVTYHEAFNHIEEKSVLEALSKLSIPTILFISYLTLSEKITPAKLIGCTLIVAGGAMILLP